MDHLHPKCFQTVKKKQVLASNAPLHYLLPERCDNDTVRSLSNSQPFSIFRARTDVLQILPPLLLEKFHIGQCDCHIVQYQTIDISPTKLSYIMSHR